MSKVTRPKLARGTKLMTGHVFAPLGTIGRQLQTSTVDTLRESRGAFAVHISVPYLDTEIANYHAVTTQLNPGNSLGYCAPFLMPPLQEYWESADSDEPVIVLEEVALSFDQRMEQAVIGGKYHDVSAGGNACDDFAGQMDFSEVDRADLRVLLYEKTPLHYIPANGARDTRYLCQKWSWQPHFLPEQVVWEGAFPANLLATGDGRSNPILVKDIGRQLSPYKVYMAAVLFPGMAEYLGAQHDDYCLPAFNLTFKMTHPLVQTPWRVAGGTNIQNNPQAPMQKIGHTDLSFTTPAAGDIVSADGTNGIATGMAALDRDIRGKYRGGLDRKADRVGPEALALDSCYDVMVVPLYQMPFNGCTRNGTHSLGPVATAPGSYHGYYGTLPYYTAPTNPVESRRIIPIPFPFEVHHVFACLNWQKTAIQSDDAIPSITHKIGVGIGNGIRSDGNIYAQVAYGTFNHKWTELVAATKPPNLLDRWTYPWNRGVVNDAVFNAGAAHDLNLSWEIRSVPLVAILGDAGVGYEAQGKPYFVGKAHGSAAGTLSYAGVQPRAPIGQVGGGVPSPACYGAEQFLEVRWQMIADDPYAQGVAGFDRITNGSTIVGYQGNFVVICGRKFLTDGR